ncbi:MAG: DUF983 domain-containing protein [Cyclobacteriaceae bacterium]
MQEKSLGYAILNHKCPRCRTGDIFRYSFLQKPAKFTATHKNCPHCDLQYEREPGFFFGAMYVSYALTMAVLLGTAFILYNFFGDPELIVYITTVPVVVLLLLPIIFRYSRTLFLHGFGGVSYNPTLAKQSSTDNS